jgi:hypothetical protein
MSKSLATINVSGNKVVVYTSTGNVMMGQKNESGQMQVDVLLATSSAGCRALANALGDLANRIDEIKTGDMVMERPTCEVCLYSVLVEDYFAAGKFKVYACRRWSPARGYLGKEDLCLLPEGYWCGEHSDMDEWIRAVKREKS